MIFCTIIWIRWVLNVRKKQIKYNLKWRKIKSNLAILSFPNPHTKTFLFQSYSGIENSTVSRVNNNELQPFTLLDRTTESSIQSLPPVDHSPSIPAHAPTRQHCGLCLLVWLPLPSCFYWLLTTFAFQDFFPMIYYTFYFFWKSSVVYCDHVRGKKPRRQQEDHDSRTDRCTPAVWGPMKIVRSIPALSSCDLQFLFGL